MKKKNWTGIYFTAVIGIFLTFTACQKEPTACFTPSASTAEAGSAISFSNCTTDGFNYVWDFGDGSTSVAENPTYTYNTAGTYTVTLVAYSKNDKKKDLISKTIKIIPDTGDVVITLQPNSVDGKDAVISSYYPSTNYEDQTNFRAEAWTYSGSPSTIRGLVEFNLSAIPSDATIVEAKLSLYHCTEWEDTGENSCLLKRITSSWDESTVTWNNQPPATTQNQVILSKSTSSYQDYTDIDVAALVQDMINNPQNSHGFLLCLQMEEVYSRLAFSSSDCGNTSLLPKLYIKYN